MSPHRNHKQGNTSLGFPGAPALRLFAGPSNELQEAPGREPNEKPGRGSMKMRRRAVIPVRCAPVFLGKARHAQGHPRTVMGGPERQNGNHQCISFLLNSRHTLKTISSMASLGVRPQCRASSKTICKCSSEIAILASEVSDLIFRPFFDLCHHFGGQLF